MHSGWIHVFAAATVSLIGCATTRTPTAKPERLTPQTANVPAAPASAAPSPSPAPLRLATIRTRHATFKATPYEELPGWRDDDITEAWSALRRSCEALNKRAHWKDICSEASASPADAHAARRFFETRFTPLQVLGLRGERDGKVTGYYEPLLEGRTRRDDAFQVPVMGVPNDMFTFDWTQIPAASRKAVLHVKPAGNRLVQASAIDTSTYALDLRQFALDDRDRRLRLRLAGSGAAARAEAYYTRAELNARGLPQGVDAPVVAWTNDPLSLYTMQVQGSGRMRTEGGKLVRLQYAEQNGHPFRPITVAARHHPRIVTRGAGPAESPEQFSLQADEATQDRDEGDDSTILTRGRQLASVRQPSTAATSADTHAVIEELLQNKRSPTPTPRRSAPAGAKPLSPLDTDPSYVFFKTAPDRAPDDGPQGALGVPLTPMRSIAVDPRIAPLGYPVFLNARTAKPSATAAPQKLVFAQDTGGAIRGAARADYFWGFGHQAGQSARATHWRTEMWVLVPNDEAQVLGQGRKLLTRGSMGAASSDSDAPSCLLADNEFCTNLPD